MGFLPEAVINFLAFLGWNPGSDEEIFSIKALEKIFDTSKIIKSGAKFNYDKAKWFNQQYIIAKKDNELARLIKEQIEEKAGKSINDEYLNSFCGLMKERVMTLNEFWEAGAFFFTDDFDFDEKTLKKKYKTENQIHFDAILNNLQDLKIWEAPYIQDSIKSYITDCELSFGAILPILRVCLTGTMKGPDVFAMMELFGRRVDVMKRMQRGLEACQTLSN